MIKETNETNTRTTSDGRGSKTNLPTNSSLPTDTRQDQGNSGVTRNKDPQSYREVGNGTSLKVSVTVIIIATIALYLMLSYAFIWSWKK